MMKWQCAGDSKHERGQTPYENLLFVNSIADSFENSGEFGVSGTS